MSTLHRAFHKHWTFFIILAAIVAFAAGSMVHAGVASAAEGTGAPPASGGGTFLADKHKAAGLECNGCHVEAPSKAPDMKVCLKCHGPYDALAAKTEKVNPNPHASHLGEEDCDSCHHGHKASVDRCGRCHAFGFKVP
jgi:hypothetical protein